MSGQPVGADTPKRRTRGVRPVPSVPPAGLAAAAIRWTQTGGNPPDELAHLHPEDQVLLYQYALDCDPHTQAALLGAEHDSSA